jgi:hypothetical protein
MVAKKRDTFDKRNMCNIALGWALKRIPTIRESQGKIDGSSKSLNIACD